MLICSQCGENVPDYVQICPSCGNPLKKEEKSKTESDRPISLKESAELKKESLDKIDELMVYFSQKKEWYDEREYCKAYIDRNLFVRVKPMLVLGIITTVLGSIMAASIKDQAWMWCYPIFGALLIAGFIAINVNRSVKNSIYSKRIPELDKLIEDYHEEYGDCPLGAEYTNPAILEKIKSIIKDGRTESIKEALNIYLDEEAYK